MREASRTLQDPTSIKGCKQKPLATQSSELSAYPCPPESSPSCCSRTLASRFSLQRKHTSSQLQVPPQTPTAVFLRPLYVHPSTSHKIPPHLTPIMHLGQLRQNASPFCMLGVKPVSVTKVASVNIGSTPLSKIHLPKPIGPCVKEKCLPHPAYPRMHRGPSEESRGMAKGVREVT